MYNIKTHIISDKGFIKPHRDDEGEDIKLLFYCNIYTGQITCGPTLLQLLFFFAFCGAIHGDLGFQYFLLRVENIKS